MLSSLPMSPRKPQSFPLRRILGTGLFCLLLLGVSSTASAQLEISESSVSEGDFNVVPGEGASYKFVIKGTKTGTTQAEAEIKPYYYIIYATGSDIYGNPFYVQLAQGRTATLYGPVTAEGGNTPATTQTFEGGWAIADATLLNYYPLRPRPVKYSAHRIGIRLYGDGITPADPPADDAAFAGPDLSAVKGQIYFYNPEAPDLAIDSVTYNAGTYDGGDIIRMTTIWKNNSFVLTPGETYKVHNYLTENAAIDWRPPADSLNPDDALRNSVDDYLLSEYVISGDGPVNSELDLTPITPDAGSIVRQVEAGPVAALPTYGILNRSVTTGVSYYGSSLRVYQPQPDDGYLDLGEVVAVTVEVKIPENYAGTYFVAGRVDPENTVPEPPNLFIQGSNLFMEIQDLSLKRKDNNSFVSNASAKITIDGPTTSPVVVEAISAIAEQDGQYIQGGGETSNQSSPTSDGTIVAFASLARNLLVPPPLAEAFIAANGRGASMAANADFTQLGYGSIGDYLTTKQQIFYRLRDTRENYLASALNGVEANADCFNPSIDSATGRYIAFDSRASNLGAPNTATRSLIYIGDTEAQSVSALLPDANGDCFNPSISANGRFVAFESVATNLDPAKPIPANNSWQQIYLHDRDSDGNDVFDETGSGKTATYLVSVNDAGKPAYGGKSLTPVVSPWEKDKTGVDHVYVAYVSYAGNLPTGANVTGNNNEQVYRVKVNFGAGGGASTVDRVSVNDNGDIANKPQGAPNGSIEPSISGDGSQVAFSSSANNLVYNPSTGVFDADTNFVSDVFVRDFGTSTTVRISESNERVATGTISFRAPSLSLLAAGNLSLVNIPQNNPQPGDTLTIESGGATQTFVFGTDVPLGPGVPVLFPETVGVLIGQDACATRDNLVDAINASGLGIVASATTATSLPASLGSPVNMAISPSIYLRSVGTGEQYNGNITFVPSTPPAPGVDPVVTDTDLTGGGTQAEDAPLVDTADPTAAPAVQRVLAGSNQPSISEDGRVVAFRSIAFNLDVQTLTPENNIDGGPPYTDLYPPSPREGELIRPVRFPASNIYVRNRAVDPGLSFDTPGNLSTAKISLNKFGYPATITAQQATGVGAWTTAANQAPVVGGNGRVVTFSSGSEGYGGLAFGRSNLDPLDFQNARDVYLYDSQTVGTAPPPSSSRPTVDLLSPGNGLNVQVGSTISLAASAVPKLGKTIASVQFFVNGAPLGDAFIAEPYALTYTLQNPGQYIVRVVATDSRGIKNTDFAVVTAKQPPSGQSSPSVSVTQPTGITKFVVGSRIELNVLATDVDGTINGDSVFFFVDGVPLKAEASAQVPGTFAASYIARKPGTVSLFAQATDNDGNTSISVPVTFGVVQPNLAPPIAEILELLPGTPTPANGVIPLRAEVDLAGADPEASVVQFLANGAVIGTAQLQADGTYLLLWKTPVARGSFTVYARVTAPNAVVESDGEEEEKYFFSVRSSNFIVINTADGVAPGVDLVLPADGSTATLNQPLTLRALAGGLPGISSIKVNTGGGGYTNVPTVTLPKPGVSAITVVNGGSGYTNVPTVEIDPPLPGDTANGAKAVAILGSGPTAGKVIRIDMTKVGSGYTTNLPRVTFSGGGGSGATATAVVVPARAEVYMAPTNIASIALRDGGTNYTSPPTVTIAGGGGSGAQATAIWDGTKVKDIILDAKGSNYTRLPVVTISGGGGSNAVAVACFSNAAVSNIVVTETGSGYSTSEPLTVSLSEGGGAGATATPSVGTPTVAAVKFYVNGLPYGEPDTTQPYESTYTPVSQGSYVFSAVAIGSDGLQSAPDDSFVAVSRGAAPTVEILNPSSDLSNFTPGSVIPISATATPGAYGARIVSIQFFVDGVSLGLPDTQAPFLGEFQVPGDGRFKIVAAATDSFGNVGIATKEVGGQRPALGTEVFVNMTHPVPAGGVDTANDFGSSSTLFLNAAVSLPTPPTNASVTITELKFLLEGDQLIGFGNGSVNAVDAAKSQNAFFQTDPSVLNFGHKWRPSGQGSYVVNAQATVKTISTNTNGVVSTNFSTTVSPPLGFDIGSQDRPLPKISLPSALIPTNITANSAVYLAAVVNGGLTPVDLVDFYANQVFLGSVAVPAADDNEDVFVVFPWAVGTNFSGNVQIAARAAQVLAENDNSVVAVAGTNSFVTNSSVKQPLVTLLQAPVAERNYVAGSELFLNVTAAPQSGGSLNTNSFQFYYRGQLFNGSNVVLNSLVPAGTNFIRSLRVPVLSDDPSDVLFATADNLEGNRGYSAFGQVISAAPQKAFPSVTMPADGLPGEPRFAGGVVTLLAEVQFPGSSGGQASGGQDRRVEFYANGALVGVGSNSTTEPSIYKYSWRTPTTPGAFVINARAIDLNFDSGGGANQGASAKFYSSVISALPGPPINTIAGSVPKVELTSPTNNAVLPVNVPTFIRADASVSGSSLKEVRFFVDGVQVGEPDTAAPYAVAFTPASPGPYQLYAIAETISGIIGVSTNAAVLNAVSGTPPAVSLIRPVATDQFFPGNPITMQAAATGYGTTISQVDFYVNGFPAASDTAPPFEASYTPPAGGPYTIFARATDTIGNVKDSTTVTVTVSDINAGGSDPNQATVLSAYQKLLNRAPTPAENQYWLGMLAGGGRQSTMVMNIMSGTEYNAHQNKLFGFYSKLGVAPVNSTYLQRLDLMKADQTLLPPPANYPPLGSDATPAPYGASSGGANAAQEIVGSAAFNAVNPGVQFYGNQDFMLWYFGKWPSYARGDVFELVKAMNAAAQPKGYAVSFINGLMYAANDVSAFDSQLKATSFQWLYFGIWESPTVPAVSNAAQLQAFIQSRLGEPVSVPAPAPPAAPPAPSAPAPAPAPVAAQAPAAVSSSSIKRSRIKAPKKKPKARPVRKPRARPAQSR